MRSFLHVPLLLLALLCSACTKDFYASGIKLSTGEATEITYHSAVLHGQLLSTGMINNISFLHFYFELSADGLFEEAKIIRATARTMDGVNYSADLLLDLEGQPGTTLAMDCVYYYRTYVYINGVYTSYGDVKQFKTDVIPYTVSAEAVDLGLSVKWSGCNLGASKAEEYGDLFSWGEVEPWDTKYIWDDPYGGSSKFPYGGYNNLTLKDIDDAAHVKLGGNWHTPSLEEWKELASFANCEWIWTKRDDAFGYLVRSKKAGFTDKCIFLPAAGLIHHSEEDRFERAVGRYMSNQLESGSRYCRTLRFGEHESYDVPFIPSFGAAPVYEGFSVRPVLR